jgi:hypothetical protein
MSNSSDCYKSRTQAKILFLETQLQELNHYLPETHEYLMSELDTQKRLLAELSVNEYFASLDSDNSI